MITSLKLLTKVIKTLFDNLYEIKPTPRRVHRKHKKDMPFQNNKKKLPRNINKRSQNRKSKTKNSNKFKSPNKTPNKKTHKGMRPSHGSQNH